MWIPFPVILLCYSLLAEALQRRAGDDKPTLRRRANFTQDVVFEEYRRQTALVPRDSLRQTGLSGIINKVKPFKSRPPPPPYEVLASHHDVVVVPLKKWGNYRLASVEIGNPAQKVDMVVHIDSPCLWATYNPDKSTSHKGKPEARRRTCESRLFGRPTVVGDVYLDQINVGEMTEKGSVFAVMGRLDGYNGGLGLALPPRFGKLSKETFIPNFISKRFHVPIFALHLTSAGGEIHFGTPIPEFHDGDIEYHDVTTTRLFHSWRRWQIGSGVIGINGDETVLSEKITTVFDNTLPYIYGPKKQVKKIYEAIRGHKEPMYPGYEYAFPCEKQVEVHFRWKNGEAWTLGPDRFNRGLIAPGTCKGIIRVDGGVEWILGLSFILSSLYLVFDGTPGYERVGLSHSALPPPYAIQSSSSLPSYPVKAI